METPGYEKGPATGREKTPPYEGKRSQLKKREDQSRKREILPFRKLHLSDSHRRQRDPPEEDKQKTREKEGHQPRGKKVKASLWKLTLTKEKEHRGRGKWFVNLGGSTPIRENLRFPKSNKSIHDRRKRKERKSEGQKKSNGAIDIEKRDPGRPPITKITQKKDQGYGFDQIWEGLTRGGFIQQV